MPVHRVLRRDLEEEVVKIERSGESIVTVVPDSMATFLIFTKARPPSIELRASYVDGPETAA